jgi:hypothetical protein
VSITLLQKRIVAQFVKIFLALRAAQILMFTAASQLIIFLSHAFAVHTHPCSIYSYFASISAYVSEVVSFFQVSRQSVVGISHAVRVTYPAYLFPLSIKFLIVFSEDDEL